MKQIKFIPFLLLFATSLLSCATSDKKIEKENTIETTEKVTKTTKTKAPQQEGYRIEVQIEGIKDTVCKLAFHFGAKKLLQDTAVVDSQGKMVFEGKETLKGGIYLITVPNKGYFEVIAEEDQFFSLKTNTTDLVKNMKVSGSKENERFYKYLNFINPIGKEVHEKTEEYKKIQKQNKKDPKLEKIRDEIKDNNKKIEEYKDNIIKEYPDSFLATLFKAMKDVEVPEMIHIKNKQERDKARYAYFKKHYFDNIVLSDPRLLRTPIFENKVDYYLDKVVAPVPDSINAAADYLITSAGENYDIFRYLLIHITSKYEKSQMMCMSDAVFYHMATNYYTKDSRVDWVDEKTMTKIKEQVVKTKYSRCGLQAINLTLPDTTGLMQPDSVKLKMKRPMFELGKVKAEYTVLYFWSATCGHCKKTTPKLYEMYKRLKPHGLEIYTVHIDENKKPLKKYLDEHQFTWITTNAPNNEFNYRVYYNVFSTPVIYLLDKNKKIIGKRMDIITLEKILSDKFGVEPPEHIKNATPEKDSHGH